MGGPMITYGHVSFLCTEDSKAQEIRTYFHEFVAKAMSLGWWAWYDEDGEDIGDGFTPVPDPAFPSTRMMIIFSGEDPLNERDLSFSAEMLNKEFPGIDAVYSMDGSQW